LRRVKDYIGEEDFCFTYGDGVTDTDITSLIKFHKSKGTLATLTSVQPPHRFGALKLVNDKVNGFAEKPIDGGWINGGFFVLSPKVIDYISTDGMMWEHAPMETLVAEGQVSAYQHDGFWHSMDTLRDKNHLEELWTQGKAPWKVW